MKPELIIGSDRADVADRAARALVEYGKAAVAARGRFVLALAGGRTPEMTYEALATHHRRSDLWLDTHFTVGDERCVPRTHEQSNQRMLWSSLLGPIGAPRERVLEPIGQEIAAEVADEAIHRRIASAYDRALLQLLGFGCAHDLVLLGMGPDGHTCSLFPPAQESSTVEPLYLPTLAPPTSPIHRRVTLSYGAIRAAREVWLLVSGGKKGEILARALRHDPELPMGKVFRDRAGAVRIFMDQEISQCLSQPTLPSSA